MHKNIGIFRLGIFGWGIIFLWNPGRVELRAHGIDSGDAVDFLGAKLQQPQAPKPHLDGLTLGYAEYNTYISFQHHKVCSCCFACKNIPSMKCYEDNGASARVFAQDLSWTLAPLALCS